VLKVHWLWLFSAAHVLSPELRRFRLLVCQARRLQYSFTTMKVATWPVGFFAVSRAAATVTVIMSVVSTAAAATVTIMVSTAAMASETVTISVVSTTAAVIVTAIISDGAAGKIEIIVSLGAVRPLRSSNEGVVAGRACAYSWVSAAVQLSGHRNQCSTRNCRSKIGNIVISMIPIENRHHIAGASLTFLVRTLASRGPANK
jgi:hypothetical protein